MIVSTDSTITKSISVILKRNFKNINDRKLLEQILLKRTQVFSDRGEIQTGNILAEIPRDFKSYATEDDEPDLQHITYAYKMTGKAKVKGAKEFLETIFSNNCSAKLIVFAHHQEVMDELASFLTKNLGLKGFMRIDGATDPRDRQEYVNGFQNDPAVKVALLSITAAGIGITLTAASIVVFAEVHWTPAVML